MKSHYQTTLHNNAGTLCTGEPASRLVAVCHSRWTGDIPADHPQTVANAERLAACWNACHGLDLPPGIATGAVAALVAAAQQVHDWHRPAKHTPEDAAWRELRAALAPFGANPAPVSPEPSGYAFKTADGYLAQQGRNHWYESEPVGWALFTEARHAAALGASMGLTGEVVPAYPPADDISRDILNPL